MSRGAIRPGHALVIPKEPIPNFFDLNEETVLDIMRIAKQIAKSIEIEFNPKRVGLIVAGFDIPHAHLHVVPMHDYHDITSKQMLAGTLESSSQEELDQNAEKIRNSLDNSL